MAHRFNVFGRLIAVERNGTRWMCFVLGDDGKRRPAELAIPAEVPREELAQYLHDVFHESATPTNGGVFEIAAAPQRHGPP
ncbi:hypothetical protein [uncultured Pseudacidovorax sp.]|uniref:DUF7661 family protein n=1 Tax=uncultured Pseudacidovorax sp. TaxID=679313 RepID=UPI0025F013F1|nr:hypothetical protein [uncultured Pseudacidovorax sp.]